LGGGQRPPRGLAVLGFRYLQCQSFGSTRAIVNASSDAWNNPIAETVHITPPADFEWAGLDICCPGRNYRVRSIRIR
jgi:hypothetical protein